jgi:predicted transcriptional regulator
LDKSIIALAAEIVAAYVSNNLVAKPALPDLIGQVHAALMRSSEGAPAPVVVEAAPIPAVRIRKSITPDFLICLEDGKKFKSLKRHLRTSYGMTPADYRAKWGLPDDYPMVAPEYAAKRSAMAKELGLGQTRSRPTGSPPKSKGRAGV